MTGARRGERDRRAESGRQAEGDREAETERRAWEDRGSATVWVAMATAALCAIFVVVLAAGQAMVARHRAGAAADLAALAAADTGLSDPRAACRVAGRVAAAQGTRVVRCAVQGEIADLTVEARTGPFAPRVRSRAGPAAALPQ